MRIFLGSAALAALLFTCLGVQAQDRSIVKSYKTDTAPVIDGEIDGAEWDAAGPWINVTVDSPNARGATDLIPDDVWGGDSDLSYRFKSMWQEDTTNFFILYEITDDIAMDSDPRNLWERDQVEIFFDGTNIEGDADTASYEWWAGADETYGKFGVSRVGSFEGNSGMMTDDPFVWDDGLGDVAALAAAMETGNNADYRVEIAVSIDPMLADVDFAPYDGTPTGDAGTIVENSTTIKHTVAAADDDNYDTGETERSSVITYYRELDGVEGDWRDSTTFATLAFVGEYVAPTCDDMTGGDLDGNGKVEFADFLTLSGNFGMDVADHTQGDIDCNGKVEFADFLELSGNFGKTVGAQSVPEPASSSLFVLAGCFAGAMRRRRK